MRRLALLVALAACGGGGGADDGDDDGPPPDAEVGVMEDVHLIGRFDAQQRFAWPGSAILTRFEGTNLTVQLVEENGPNQYDVTVDGTTTVLVTGGGDQTYPIATGLAAGAHDVAIARRTESFFGITRFAGFSGGTLVATARPTRLIEFIGDSITCGYGVLGDVATCSFTADTEAETHAWGALAAAELGAAHTAIAYSGIGVYRNYGDEPGLHMPDYFSRTFADSDQSPWDWSYRPDAVVINLGTNDFSVGDPGQGYIDAYTTFIEQIRAQYGANIEIVVVSSPMLGEPDHTTQAGHLADVIAAAGDHVTYVNLATQLDSDGYGCDYHPNETTQQKMADALVPALRSLLGW
jgi:lysophospholipase L1-like esterase